jgi:hypothetical protein
MLTHTQKIHFLEFLLKSINTSYTPTHAYGLLFFYKIVMVNT